MIKKGKALLLSATIVFGASAILLALSAFILERMSTLPKEHSVILTTLIGSVAIFTAGFLTALHQKEKGLLYGLFGALLLTACTAGISALLFQVEFTVSSIGKAAAYFLSGSIGGILGVNRKRKVKF